MFKMNFYFIVRFVLFTVVIVSVMYFLLVKDACDYDFDISEALGFNWSYGGEECISKENYIYIFSPQAEFEIPLGLRNRNFEENIRSSNAKRWKEQPMSNCWERIVYFEKRSLVTIAKFCSGQSSMKVYYSLK